MPCMANTTFCENQQKTSSDLHFEACGLYVKNQGIKEHCVEHGLFSCRVSPDQLITGILSWEVSPGVWVGGELMELMRLHPGPAQQRRSRSP